MGHHLSSLDAPGRDLLGALRPHWESDWRFDRFVSEGNGTIDSLARLLVRSPMKAIGQSSAASAKFAGNAFAPYLQRGYRVLFVTSGTATWRNLGPFVRQQGARVHRPADAAPALSRGADRHLGRARRIHVPLHGGTAGRGRPRRPAPVHHGAVDHPSPPSRRRPAPAGATWRWTKRRGPSISMTGPGSTTCWARCATPTTSWAASSRA